MYLDFLFLKSWQPNYFINFDIAILMIESVDLEAMLCAGIEVYSSLNESITINRRYRHLVISKLKVHNIDDYLAYCRLVITDNEIPPSVFIVVV
jgi:hypothetical protein